MFNFLLQEQASEPSVLNVCIIGIGVVFVGLLFLVWIIKGMTAASSKKNDTAAEEHPIAQQPVTAVQTEIPNKQEIIAAVCAAVAEENGTDISAIRVHSFKRL